MEVDDDGVDAILRVGGARYGALRALGDGHCNVLHRCQLKCCAGCLLESLKIF